MVIFIWFYYVILGSLLGALPVNGLLCAYEFGWKNPLTKILWAAWWCILGITILSFTILSFSF